MLCSIYRFCSLAELEEVMDQLVGVPFSGLCAIMLAVHQEFCHPAKPVQKKHELNTLIV